MFITQQLSLHGEGFSLQRFRLFQFACETQSKATSRSADATSGCSSPSSRRRIAKTSRAVASASAPLRWLPRTRLKLCNESRDFHMFVAEQFLPDSQTFSNQLFSLIKASAADGKQSQDY
jgi:hypothetical protein